MDRATKAGIWCTEIHRMLDGEQSAQEAVENAEKEIARRKRLENAAEAKQEGEREAFSRYKPNPHYTHGW